MWKKLTVALGTFVLIQTPAYAINAKYRQQLERSGCTQVSEAQCCDINKTTAENAKAGFVSEVPADQGTTTSQTP